MTQSLKTRNRIILYVALPFLLYGLFSLIVGGAYVLAVVGGHYRDDTTLYASSPDDARGAGVYLDTVIVEPRVVRYGDYEVTFANCWLQQLRTSHRPAWYAPREESKQPRALFILNFRTTYRGKPLVDSEPSDNVPVLRCEEGGGGTYIGQEANQHIEVYADLLPVWGLAIDLPLRLNLFDGSARLPARTWVAHPAHLHAWPTK